MALLGFVAEAFGAGVWNIGLGLRSVTFAVEVYGLPYLYYLSDFTSDFELMSLHSLSSPVTIPTRRQF